MNGLLQPMTASRQSLAELPQHPRSLQNPIAAGRASDCMTLSARLNTLRVNR
jgi:hypothetical protein